VVAESISEVIFFTRCRTVAVFAFTVNTNGKDSLHDLKLSRTNIIHRNNIILHNYFFENMPKFTEHSWIEFLKTQKIHRPKLQ